MRRKDAEREEARRLRAQGMSVKRIAAVVGVSVSSVSVWVRDVELPPPAPEPGAPDAEPLVWSAPDGGSAFGAWTIHAIAGPLREALRHCPRCDRVLPVEAFNRNGDGRQHWCRDCFRAYFRDRGDKHREQSDAARERRRAAARQFLRTHLLTHPCVDCGEDDIFVLEFDHVGDKTAHVAVLLAGRARLERIKAEVAQCEVVCVNCHRRRTARRAGWFRATGIAPPGWGPSQVRNQLHLVETLGRHGCADCGERDLVVLEFDHLDDKREKVTRLAQWCSLEVLQAEIAKCVIRCANCHRLRTLASGPACWREEDHWAIELFTTSEGSDA